jgi:hypothetical protein
MLTLAIIAVGILLLAGLAALLHATGHAPEGHEDRLGFHASPEHRSRQRLMADAPAPTQPEATAHALEVL